MNRSFRQAITDLATAQKSSRGVSLYSRFVNRPIGRILAAAAYRAGMSPNQVTALSAVVTAAGIILLATGGAGVLRGVAVAALLVLGFALDSADGQVARLTGRGSRAGEWLDHVVDAGKIVAVHGAVLICAFRSFALPAWTLLIPLLFQVVSVVVFFGGELHVHLRAPGVAAGAPSVVRSIGLLPADYGILAVSFVLLGWHVGFAVVYGLLFLANLAIGALLTRKWFGSLAAADPTQG